MVWSHNDVWMVTADHTGYVKYWQSNMNSVKVFLAHKEAIRGIRYIITSIKIVIQEMLSSITNINVYIVLNKSYLFPEINKKDYPP